MKKLFIVANWKCNKTMGEAEEWLDEVQTDLANLSNLTNLEIVLCVPFTLLPLLSAKVSKLKSLKVKLGAQDVSPFPDGAYTGEISARMLKDLGVEDVMIGHSERRKYFHEDEAMLENKVREAQDAGLRPIFCVRGLMDSVPAGVEIILYEPMTAIGSGQAESAEEVNEVARKLKEKLDDNVVVLYGGSVVPKNVNNFCQEEFIDGVGIGGASLDVEKFLQILNQVQNDNS